MNKNRLEAFSDGVLAIIITIMVLELKTPHEASWEALRPLLPVLVSYALSFVFVGIYWGNHHHLFQAVERVNGTVLWLNMHLLFWLSLIPFGTAWMAETHFATLPVFVYGCMLLGAGIAFTLMARCLVAIHGKESLLATLLGNSQAAPIRTPRGGIDSDLKGKISTGLYGSALVLVWLNTWIAYAIYIAVALLWIMPDRRIEAMLEEVGRAKAKGSGGKLRGRRK